MVGIIRGRKIKRNRDGDKERVILQVEILTDDIRTVELFTQCGEDTNPADGCKVNILNADGYKIGVGISDGITPECKPGEKEFYSTDNPVTSKLAKIKLNKDSEIILNDGLKSAVNYQDLVVALNTFATAVNSVLATKLDGGGSAGVLTIDISSAEVPKVKL
jgi:hypothetical protein